MDHIQHLYVANNVKTSSFSIDQSEKSNLSNTKSNLNSSHDLNSKYNCSHSSINMVPERDTGPKMTAGQVNAVGSSRLQNKCNGEANGGEDTRLMKSRPHHHVSVQELRMQVNTFTILMIFNPKFIFFSNTLSTATVLRMKTGRLDTPVCQIPVIVHQGK